jgi:muramoyltetrapeptide carboxypeptidase LdcA involved in peptidoglycan recycling
MIMPNASGDSGWVSAAAEARADDIHDAFLNDAVTAVVCSTGGDHSNQLLKHLDYELIRSHPKVFQGYSDITVLHWAFMKHAGLKTFYGPAFCLGMAEYPKVLDYTDYWMKEAWFGGDLLSWQPPVAWTQEFLDFNQQKDLERARAMTPGTRWKCLRPGVADGPLYGGCFETICWHLKGSTEWLDMTDAVFFFETSEQSPKPDTVDALLADLENLGVFQKVAAVVMGRPHGYSDADKERVWELVLNYTSQSGVPVLADIDCGHTDPMLTFPLGARVHLDAGNLILRTLEPATAPR